MGDHERVATTMEKSFFFSLNEIASHYKIIEIIFIILHTVGGFTISCEKVYINKTERN